MCSRPVCVVKVLGYPGVVTMQVRVGALVQGVLDITGASPRRFFFEVLQHFATSELEVDRLEYFATPAGRDDLYIYNQKEGVPSLSSHACSMLAGTAAEVLHGLPWPLVDYASFRGK